MLKERIDLYSTVINPSQDDMRFVVQTMQDIINTTLNAGKKKKK